MKFIDHETVEIYNPFFKEKIQIDVAISELISLLWDIDIMTLNSCQENKPGIIWIEFPFFEADRFLNIICNKHFDSVYNGIMQNDIDSNWKFDVSVDDMSEYINEKDEIDVKGSPQITFNLSVRFPIKKYTMILNRVKKWKMLDDKKKSIASDDSLPILDYPVFEGERDNDLPF